MAFQGAGFDIIIDAVLTDVGKEKMAKGDFKVSKFSFGDDEIDYRLFDQASDDDEGYTQMLLTASTMEAYSHKASNILYGIQSFPRQDLLYLPILKINKAKKISTNPTLTSGFVAETDTTGGAQRSGSAYLLSVNSETTSKINSIFSTGSFSFLDSDSYEKNKIIIESGISEKLVTPSALYMPSDATAADFKTTYAGRIYQIVSRGLLDQIFMVYADKRFIEKIYAPDTGGDIGTGGSSCGSVFRNFKDGSSDINFVSSNKVAKVSYQFLYDNYDCYISEGIANMISDFDTEYTEPLNKDFSELGGPKGSVTALNFSVDQELKGSSTSARNYRYTDFGKIDQYVFDKTHKFDYIDTNVYVEGATSKASVVVPLRIIRYVGT